MTGSVTPPRGGQTWRPDPEAGRHWDLQALGASLDASDLGTGSVVVLEQGRVVAERHREPDGAAHHVDVASVQKTVVMLLVGVAADRGLLRVEDRVSDHLPAGWARDAAHEGEVTVRHLLSMTAGLLTGDEPGTIWAYDTMAFHVLKAVLTAATDRSLDDVTAAWLAEPLGLEHSSWVPREPFLLPPGTPAATRAILIANGFAPDPDGRYAQRLADGSLATAFVSSARDLARLGHLIAAGGLWGGERVVSASWLERACSASQDHNRAYGWLVWRNADRGATWNGAPFERFEPAAPADLVCARGARSNLVDASPSTGLVLARVTAGPVPPAGEDGVSHALWAGVSAARVRAAGSRA